MCTPSSHLSTSVPLCKRLLRLNTSSQDTNSDSCTSLQMHNVNFFFTTAPNSCSLLPSGPPLESPNTPASLQKPEFRLCSSPRLPASYPCSANFSLPQMHLCRTLVKNTLPGECSRLPLPSIPSHSLIDGHLQGRSPKGSFEILSPNCLRPDTSQRSPEERQQRVLQSRGHRAGAETGSDGRNLPQRGQMHSQLEQ